MELAGVRDEPMLYSYIINPTYTNHSLAEIAVRSFNLKLSLAVPEAADVTGRISPVLRKEVEDRRTDAALRADRSAAGAGAGAHGAGRRED